jgi:hypothetical protein
MRFSDRNFEIRSELRQEPERVEIHNWAPRRRRGRREIDFVDIAVHTVVGLVLFLMLVGYLVSLKPKLSTKEKVWRSSEQTTQDQNRSPKSPESMEKNSSLQRTKDPNPKNSPRQNGREGVGGGNTPVSYAGSREMESGTTHYERKFSQAPPIPRGGPDWILGDSVYKSEIQSNCGGFRHQLPPGRTAGIYFAATGRTSLDTISGPASLVLFEGFCLESGEVNFCVVCRGSS